MVQAPPSSIFSRKIVNLFAGMAYGSPELPGVLRDGGYRCHAIEPTFGVAGGRQVNPEIVLCSEAEEHTLIVEAKSGANLKPEQLARYSDVSAQSLERQAFTSTKSATNHDILIVGKSDFEDRLLVGSALVPSIRRVLSVVHWGETSPAEQETSVQDDPAEKKEPAGIRRIENEFSKPRLNEAFNPTLEIDWEIVPNGFLPVDHESTEWEFAEFVFPEVIVALLAGQSEVRSDEIAKSFIRHWDFLGTKYRKSLLERIHFVVKLASQTRFSPFIKGLTKNRIMLTTPDNIQGNQAAVRSQLQKRFRNLMDDLKSPQIAFIYPE